MAGASDISAILSQAGRIEKINQNPFVQSEVARQILTEEEAKQRLRKNREVNESKKTYDIATKDREREKSQHQKKEVPGEEEKASSESESQETGKRHIIDVLV
jgi:hypothetical protein